MKSFLFSLRFAYRDARGSSLKLIVFGACVVCGIAALLAGRILAREIENVISTRLQSLVGADVMISSREPLPADLPERIEKVGSRISFEDQFRSTVIFERTGFERAGVRSESAGDLASAAGDTALPVSDRTVTQLVQVRAVDLKYPLYGELQIEPAAATLADPGTCLIEGAVALRLDLQTGDYANVAGKKYRIGGIIADDGTGLSMAAQFVPRIYIQRGSVSPQFLNQKGALVDHILHLAFTNEAEQQLFEAKIRPTLPATIEVNEIKDRQRSLSRNVGRVLSYVRLGSLIAFAIGALGIIAALHLYLSERIATAGILRAVGATSAEIATAFAAQCLAIALGAAAVGSALGSAAAGVGARLLPTAYRTGISLLPNSADLGWAFGSAAVLVLTASLPDLIQLAGASLRRIDTDAGRLGTIRLVRAGLVLFLGLILAILCADIFDSAKIGFIASAALITAGLLLVVCGIALRRAARILGGYFGSFSCRFGVAALYRPQNHTIATIAAIGAVVLLCQVVLLAGRLIGGEISLARGESRANVFLFDIQPDQRDPLLKLISDHGGMIAQESPVVLMRLNKVKEIPVGELLRNPKSEIPSWALKREYWSSYRANLGESERIVEGTWVGKVETGLAGSSAAGSISDPIPISVEDRLMERLGVRLGDTLEFEIQGLIVPTKIASIRNILWERLQQNSFLIFPTGVLEEVPQFRFIGARFSSPNDLLKFSRAAAKQFPNISLLDLTAILTAVDDLLARLTDILTFLGFFLSAAAASVLLTSVVSSASVRKREAALLRVVGASSRILYQTVLVEYLLLGTLAALAGTILALPIGRLVSGYLFEVPFYVPYGPMIGIAIVVIGLVSGISWFSLRGVASRESLAVLREDR